MRLLLALVGATALGALIAIAAQPVASPTLVRDLNPMPVGSPGLLWEVACGGRRAFFGVQNRFDSPSVLWGSDGTAPGTVPLTPELDTLRMLGDFEGTFYFAASLRPGGEQLWRSDGTPASTLPLPTDVARPLPIGSVDEILLFVGNHATRGAELWRSDGTVAGTFVLATLGPALADSAYLVGGTGQLGGSLLLFSSRAVWRTDGTRAGTSRLKLFSPDTCFDWHVTPMNGALLFAAPAPGGGLALWRTDGTEAGTVPVTTILPGVPNCGDGIYERTLLGERLVFAACGRGRAYHQLDCTLWAHDATGTVPLLAYTPGPSNDGDGPEYPEFTIVDDRAYFQVDTGIVVDEPEGDEDRIRELFVTDGTPNGTGPATGPVPSPSLPPAGPQLADPFVNARRCRTGEGRQFFVTSPGYRNLNAVWTGDGTEAGTHRVPVAVEGRGNAGSAPLALVRLGDTVLFTADDGVRGRELWRTDGSAAGTTLVRDLVPGHPGSAPERLLAARGRVFFTALDARGWRRLWTTDGTEAGTVDVAPELPDRHFGQLIALGDALFFTVADASARREVWRHDARGTARVAAVDASRLMTAGATLFFVTEETDGLNLWASDGRSAGTRLGRVFSGPDGAVHDVAAAADRLLLLGRGADELWASDGAGVAPLASTPFQSSRLVPLGGAVFFARGPALWRSDGTPAGTAAVIVPEPGTGIADVVGVGSTLFFHTGTALYRSDGTGPRTARVLSIPQAFEGARIVSLLPAGPLLTFGVRRPDGESVLWASDGTPAGTAPLSGLAPCTGGGHVLGGALLLAATDRQHSCEPWRLPLCEGGPCGVAACTAADGCEPIPCTPAHDCRPAADDLCRIDGCAPGGCTVDLPACAGQRLPARIRRPLALARGLASVACSPGIAHPQAAARRARRRLDRATVLATGAYGLSRACAIAVGERIEEMQLRLTAWQQGSGNE